VRVFCHRSRTNDLAQLAGKAHFAQCVAPFGEGPFAPLPGVNFHGIDLAHDVEGSHGFLIEGFGQTAGFATDLGQVPAHLIERFARVDLLAMESNYDPDMQQASDRPWFLKQRIMGGRGHLSNEQAFAAVTQILDRCEQRRRRLPEHIVLLHRSRQCNCPRRVRSLFEQDPRIARRLTLTEQDTRTGWLGATPSDIGEQLMLGFQ
jgi:phosphoribosyl 1,2-cyclic phosphodiesterase